MAGAGESPCRSGVQPLASSDQFFSIAVCHSLMDILAHRGLWEKPGEKNSLHALRTALTRGFGIETDIRDHLGRLVISHDPPAADASHFQLSELLDIYRKLNSEKILALNIKSDGLHSLLRDELDRHGIGANRYFVFDMSVPDAMGYLQQQMPCYTRESEIEPVPAFINEAAGVWLDCLRDDWIDGSKILEHLESGRSVALVSPELHGREHYPAWQVWRKTALDWRRRGKTGLALCTDRVIEAETFFNGED